MIKENGELNGKEVKPRTIAWEVFRIGGITFSICAIFPVIMTIIFLVKFMPEIRAWTFTLNIYGELLIGIDLSMVIMYWFVIALPLPIAASIGKGVMFTKKPQLGAILIPIIALVLVICFSILGIWIADGVTYRWV